MNCFFIIVYSGFLSLPVMYILIVEKKTTKKRNITLMYNFLFDSCNS